MLLYNKNQKVPEITIIAEYNNIATLRKLAVNRYFTLLEEGEIDDGADQCTEDTHGDEGKD